MRGIQYIAIAAGCGALIGVMGAQTKAPASNSAAMAPVDPGTARTEPTTSPVAYFRKLLAMSPTEMEKELAGKPESQQGFLRSKLFEYKSLPTEERELRLRTTELRWYFLKMVKEPATNRLVSLTSIPVEDRKLVQERVKQWDRLTPDVQKEILENEVAMRYFIQLKSGTAQDQKEVLASMSPEWRRKVEGDLKRWNDLPSQQREEMLQGFNQFFELSEKEKFKIVHALTGHEREQMEKTIQAFEQLPSEQRQRCMKSLQKFAQMTKGEQVEFFRNAERWSQLTAVEQETFRRMWMELPPMPAGSDGPPAPFGLVPGATPSALPPIPGDSLPVPK